MILHIPHSSTYIPPEYSFDKRDISSDIFRMTDWYTDELFFHTDSDRIEFKVSRLVCDVERFINDDPMEKYGMGVVYSHDSYGGILRYIDTQERDEIIEKYYKPHHKKLTQSVARTLSMFDRAVIVDCHSFNDYPMPHDEYEGDRPDICIGMDSFHTPLHVVENFVEILEKNGMTYKINIPFSGSIVPSAYYQKNKDVWSVMIEVNKRLYMDGEQKSSNFDNTKQLITELLNTLSN